MRKNYLFGREPKKYEVYKSLINSYEWQKLRRKKFIINPICEDCERKGRITPTEEVHHNVPVESGKDEEEMRRLAYDFNNLVSLCRTCHAERHAPKQVENQKDSVKKLFKKFLE